MSQQHSNKDPITGTPGAHPIGAAVGAIAGPAGAVAGAIIGAAAGAVVGKSAAEVINPTVEAEFWRESHSVRPYADATLGYEEYAPAYRYGWESYASRTIKGQTFENVEAELNRGWDKAKGTSRLLWDTAREATREAWNRVQRADSGHRVRQKF